ncbi:hypothetical protein QBC39DRAFT_137919 [Podospora conica]|nr:hypothetical protein QBC39DRAFT_137919 [Schizothecium conicum]
MAESTAPAAAPAPAPAAPVRPTRPDEDLFKANLEKAEKEYAASLAKYNAVKQKIDEVTPGKGKESTPTQKRRQELIAQLTAIRQQQAGGKNARTAKQDQIKRLDEQLRSRITEQKVARGKVEYKSVDEVDQEIARLDRQVSGGMMKLVDERKALEEMSKLRKLRKNFGQFDDAQKQIDDLKSKIKDIKDSMDDPEAKALGEKYSKLQAELDVIKAGQDEVYKNLSGLRDQRAALQKEQSEKFAAIRALKDAFYGQKKAYMAFEREQRDKQREKFQAERDRIAKERKMERAQKMLEEASDPAYLEEIRRANSLLHFFDPSHKAAEKTPLLEDKGLGAQPQRTVDATGIKGSVLMSKKDRDDDYLPAVKKGKKSKKTVASETSTKTFSCPPAVMEDCAFIGIDPPMSAADVPAAAEKVKAKLEQWKAGQVEQTRKNVEKAKKEIERLEAEEAAEAAGVATPNGAKGEKTDKSEKETVAEVVEAVEKVKIDAKEEPITA